jgi:signal transduction histidine kinase
MSRPSLSARLTRMNLLVSGVVLLIAAVAFFSFDLLSFRNTLIRNLDAEAQIVGDNSVSALIFNDQQSAATTLKSLQRSPAILGAALTTSDGTVFARYGHPNLDQPELHLLDVGETERVWSSGTHVLVAHRIVFQGKAVGVVYIAAQLTEIGRRARQYILIAFLILLFCMAAALVISNISRRLIAQPIISLADTALLVSRDRDYSLRAKIDADASEIAVLVEAFNTMLAQIEQRDAALNEARTDLEVRVKERTAELQVANRELEAFSYTVAHDLRGPLDAISGIAFLLAQRAGNAGDRNIGPMVDQIRISTANMGSLIDDLLNFARATTVAVKSTPVDLSAIAHEISADLTRSHPGRRVDFVIDKTPEVLADAGLIRIVLDNLLRNSWKYTSHHPHACIEFGATQTFDARQRGGGPAFFVRDDGAGFDPSDADRLFQPFQRLHGKSDFPGTGIGLATVQRILSRHGGSIWAEGAVEKGATFYFDLGAEASPGRIAENTTDGQEL